LLIALALLLGLASSAFACTLDGIASLSVNGVLANLTSGRPTQANSGYWAPFTMLAQGSGHTLQLSEDLSKVAQSLPPALLNPPFRWSFGDGATAYGHTVQHTYAQPGWYKITVSYDWKARHQWVVFDSAEQQIVASGDVWKTHLGYYLDTVLQVALNGIIWIIAALIVAAMLWELLRRRVRG
jgi:hypothetical protein